MDYPPALFDYAVTPNVVPYTTDSDHITPVTLMITVNNPTPKFVNCNQLTFSIPVGNGAGDLTNNPTAINPYPGLGVRWSITSDDAGNLTAVPSAGTSGIGVGDSIAFLISDIEVNEVPGLVLVNIWEDTDQLRYTNRDVSKAPPGLAITSFTANPVQISAGDRTTLSWTTTGALSCTLSWQGNTKRDLDVDGTHPVYPEITTTYTLTATSTPDTDPSPGDDADGGSSVSQQVTVYVPQVSILSFGASPAEVAQDAPTHLSWLVNNATKCRITPGGKNVDPISGTIRVFPHLSGSYDLSASGFGRTVSMPAPVTVMPVIIGRFTATPSQLPPGGTLSSTLQWRTEWATACSIDGVGKVHRNGTHPVTPSSTTTYALHPVGLNPPASEVTVTVCPAITSVQIFTYPNSSQLTVFYWTVGGMVTVSVGGGPPVQYQGPSGGIYTSGPVSLCLAVSGLGLSSSLSIQAPGAVTGVSITNLTLSCGYGVNAPGAPASLSWNVQGGQPTGTVAAKTVTQFGGATGSIVFDVGPGANSGGDPWQLTLHLTDDTSPSGPSISMSGALPTSVTSETDARPPGTIPSSVPHRRKA
jgi:hypothetical protein